MGGRLWPSPFDTTPVPGTVVKLGLGMWATGDEDPMEVLDDACMLGR